MSVLFVYFFLSSFIVGSGVSYTLLIENDLRLKIMQIINVRDQNTSLTARLLLHIKSVNWECRYVSELIFINV